MADFLVANGIQEASRWRSSYPTYHLELAISAGDIDAPFSWKSAQVDRAEKYHIRDANKVKDVMILVRISNIYSQPSYQLFADPWRLIFSAQMGVQAGPVIKAVIKPQKETNSRPGSSLVLSSLNQSGLKILPFITHTAYEGSRTSFGAQSTHINDSHLPEKALFYYPPLRDGEIRLLRLSPGENREDLRGIIYSLPFRAAQSFHAASYVWGDADVSKHKITTPEGFVPITISLYGVLKRLRNVHDPVLIWVDAICIDQSDAIEKATQIQLLPRIFPRASSTLVVLSQGPISEFAMEMLMQVRTHTLCETGSSEWPDDLPHPPRSWGERGMPPEDEHTSYLITKLFEDPWFTRVWIVQEAVASPVVKFVCGKYIVDWDHLYDSVCHLKQNLQLPAAVHRAWRPFNALSKLRVWEARQVRWSILLLLETFRNVRSTLTRDRLFALLGIACDGDLPELTPDYQAPLQDVALSKSAAAKKRPSGGAQARRSKRNAKNAAAKKNVVASSAAASGPAVRYTARNPPPGWKPEALDPPCENCIRGVISGKRGSPRCPRPLAKRYVIAAQYCEDNIPLEDEEDPNDPYVWSEDDLREHKFEKRLKPAMRMVLDLLDEDEDIHNFFEPSAYATPRSGSRCRWFWCCW
ncbi:hypothetical protein LRP88_12528 [Fusarium phalaenopsidis]